jgi:LuxR family quorum sensing-dependent transcriptional regulator
LLKTWKMQPNLVDLVATIAEIDRARTRGEALQAFRCAMESFGFRDFLISGLPVPHDGQWDREVVCDGWSPEWHERYSQQGHYFYDPCAARSRMSSRPFLWHQIASSEMAEGARRVMNEASEFGMCDGICVPIHVPLCGPAVVTAASDRIEVPLEALPFLETLCVHIFHALSEPDETAVAECRPLTPREREVLQWSSAGKSAADIATILNVTKNTVESHHRNARDKLDAINIVHAVTKALRRHEIQI